MNGFLAWTQMNGVHRRYAMKYSKPCSQVQLRMPILCPAEIFLWVGGLSIPVFIRTIGNPNSFAKERLFIPLSRFTKGSNCVVLDPRDILRMLFGRCLLKILTKSNERRADIPLWEP